MEISKLLLSNYLPYAKSTIISRAIPSIDGLKPVQRRLLYTMYKLGLLNGDRHKCQKISGAVMTYHPHGDSAIYECLVLLCSKYAGMNVPYVDGKGSFGKVYSRDLQYSAARYTEAKLAKICNELFESIDEDAVEFIDNYDSTTKEPTLLPVKFPSILVNTSSGVAVGTSSNIPSFSLKNVCLATQGIINGDIKTPADLAKVLGAPEFTTGGFLHADEKSLTKLCETGKGSFAISGHVEVYTNQIVIDEIPYCTTAEDIMDTIDERMKEGELKGIRNVQDEIGLDGLRLVIEIKSGYNSREVLKELCRLTPLRTRISFRTRVILGNRCRELGLLDVLTNWIEFRELSIQRIYNFRLNKNKEREHLLITWEKIRHDLVNVVNMIAQNTDDVAKTNLINNYGLDEEQAEYLLNMKIRSITTDKAIKSLKELDEIRDKISYNNKIVSNIDERKKIIYDELEEIINKYGTDNKTILAPELTEEDTKVPEVKISDELTTVVFTREGYIKRLTSLNDSVEKYVAPNGDKEVYRWSIRNNQHLLVFDRFGVVHKILVDDIDSGRGKLVDKLYEKAGLEKAEDLIWADACGDYSKHFNLIYPRGKGVKVYYSVAKAEGKRQSYKAGYDEVQPRGYWVTAEDKFFMTTNRRKASYVDVTTLGIINTRTAFNIGRLAKGDWFTRLITYKNVPNPEFIDLERYSKDYTVSIGDDVLWDDGTLSNKSEETASIEETTSVEEVTSAEETTSTEETTSVENKTDESTNEFLESYDF